MYNIYMYDFIFNEDLSRRRKTLSVRGFTLPYKEMLFSVLGDSFTADDRSPQLIIAESDAFVKENKVPVIIIGASTGGKKKNRIYLSRPVDIKELRKTALSLAAKQNDDLDPDVVITNDEAMTVSYKGITASLTKLEYKLFLMLKNAGAPLSREDIRTALWQNTDKTNISDVYVCYLRKKLSALFGDGFLTSVRGKGYIMRLP